MSLAEIARQGDLHRVGGRPPLRAYLAETWQRRHFITMLARYRIRSHYERNRLGIFWVVLRPVLNATVYGFIFGVLQGNSRPADYPAYVVVGVFFWEFFQGCLNDGARAIIGNRSLVQSLAFPRITLPLSVVVEKLLTFLATLVVLVPILAYFGQYPKITWLWIIPLVFWYAIFNTGVALIAARLTVHLTDLTNLLPFISRILFYTSGVLFAVDKIFANHPLVQKLYDFHPIYQVLKIARYYLIHGNPYPSEYWYLLALGSVGLCVLGFFFFWSAEERYGSE